MKVAVANGRVAVGCDRRRLILKPLKEQNDKQSDLSEEMHKQWLNMEKMKLQQEQEERERERAHEMRLIEMFATMIHRAHTPAPPSLIDHYQSINFIEHHIFNYVIYIKYLDPDLGAS